MEIGFIILNAMVYIQGIRFRLDLRWIYFYEEIGSVSRLEVLNSTEITLGVEIEALKV